MESYDEVNNAWSEVDYAYIGHYLGEEYVAEVRKAEKIKQEEAKAFYEKKLREALDFQRSELLQKLRNTRKEFLMGMQVEAQEMSSLLEISRAFVYSYFDALVSSDKE